jgi:hypothetical protein
MSGGNAPGGNAPGGKAPGGKAPDGTAPDANVNSLLIPVGPLRRLVHIVMAGLVPAIHVCVPSMIDSLEVKVLYPA